MHTVIFPSSGGNSDGGAGEGARRGQDDGTKLKEVLKGCSLSRGENPRRSFGYLLITGIPELIGNYTCVRTPFEGTTEKNKIKTRSFLLL